MLLTFVAIAACAGFGYVVFNSKKTINKILLEIYWEYQFQLVGLRAVFDDHVRREKNRLPDLRDRSGQVAVITGGGRGIGVEIVKELLKCNMKVVMGIRKPEAATKLIETFRKEGISTDLDAFKLDVSSLKSVKNFASEVSAKYPEINLLINNAGVMFGDFNLTEEGFENQLATNYLGHFYLSHLLMPILKKGGSKTEGCSRIVNVSSCAHYAAEISFEDINLKLEYISKAAYGQSKLAQIMFARYLNVKLEAEDSKVKCYSVHPGVVNTELFDNTPIAKHAGWIMRTFFKTPEQGAISVLYTALSPKLENRGGLYVSNCRQGLSSRYSENEDIQKRLFEVSCEMVNVKDFGVVA